MLFLIGELLEGVAAGTARASIQGLTKLVPKTALARRRRRPGREVPADTLAVGAMILVRPGDRIPADGVIVAGDSAIDEAPVTGESTPKRKGGEDDRVRRHHQRRRPCCRVRVTAAAADNTIARVVRLVEEAQESKAPTERFIDRFSRYYTPGVVAVAALVAVVPPLLFGGAWSDWIYKGLAILLIGCPCALVISTPAAIAAGLSAGARRGLLLKGGAVLEQIGKITAVALRQDRHADRGQAEGHGRDRLRPQRGQTCCAGGGTRIRIQPSAGERRSWPAPRPTDSAATGCRRQRDRRQGRRRPGSEGVKHVPRLAQGGRRVRARSMPTRQTLHRGVSTTRARRSLVLVMDDTAGRAIAMRDEPRPDAKTGLKLLSDAGIRTVMLTGDNRRTAKAIGQKLGIEVRAELLPQDKQRIVGELQSKGLVVAKVGDGINDAPALAAADVGIAMGGGTDVALETADAAVLHGRVADVAAMVDLSQADHGEHPPEHHGRARPEGGVPGHHGDRASPACGRPSWPIPAPRCW